MLTPGSNHESQGAATNATSHKGPTSEGGSRGDEIEARILGALNGLIPLPLSLVEVCTRVETELARMSLVFVAECAATFAHTHSDEFQAAGQGRFRIGRDWYEARTIDSAEVPATLELMIRPIAILPERRVVSRLAMDVPGPGRYAKVLIVVESPLLELGDQVAADVATAYESGYRWLQAHVLGELTAVEHRLILGLYMEVRSVLPSPLADIVALYAMDRRAAFYLLDPIAVQSALARALSRRSNAGSPLELITMLVTQSLDPDVTVARASLAEDQALVVRLEASRYAETGLNFAEGVFYDTPSLVSQPLVRDRRLRLTAVYPAHLQADIEPRLAGIASRLDEIVRLHSRFAIRRAFGRERASTAPDALKTVMQAAGWFASGVIDGQK
jgi:hypothetical protein